MMSMRKRGQEIPVRLDGQLWLVAAFESESDGVVDVSVWRERRTRIGRSFIDVGGFR